MQTFHGVLDLEFEQRPRTERPGYKSHWALNQQHTDTPLRLQSGDLLTIFNTISAGEVLWSGTIDLEYEREMQTGPSGHEQQALDGCWINGLQRDLEPQAWMSMFDKNLPATLERNGVTIYGAMHPYSATGTEGILWALSEYGKKDYDGLHIFEKGDKLTVYTKVTAGNILLSEEIGLTDAPYRHVFSPYYTENVSKTPTVSNPSGFGDAFIKNYPAILKRVGPT